MISPMNYPFPENSLIYTRRELVNNGQPCPTKDDKPEEESWNKSYEPPESSSKSTLAES
jgi:hypothetical protein